MAQLITWLAFVGKMVEFAATKLGSKKIDLSLDPKRRAGRTFLKLHHLISELEAVTIEVSRNLDQPMVEGRYRETWLYNIDNEITRLSNDFLHLALDLEEVLRIYDPNLALSLAHLRFSKFSLLTVISDSFRAFSSSKNPDVQIQYTYPDSAMNLIDFEQHYQWLLKNPDYALGQNFNYDKLEWPQNVLIGFAEEGLIHEVSIPRVSLEEQWEALEQLRKVLNEHLSILSTANDHLREFIKKSFKIEDVMY
jgi:hypothetical protein